MQKSGNEGEIIVFSPTESQHLEVRVVDESVWLTQAQIVELFESSKSNVSEHLKRIFLSEELNRERTVRKFRTVRFEGGREVGRNVEYYNLDVIISVGYRVNTKRGILFRQWATNILKEYMLKGYSVNNKFVSLEDRIDRRLSEHDRRLDQIDKKVDSFIKKSLPPCEGVFFDGQIFDAYVLIASLIKSAKERIVIIDNYLDESILLQLTKRRPGVKVEIYTKTITRQFNQDVKCHNQQYPGVEVYEYNRAHDRFLIIDDDPYHIGASLKDLGKKLFGFSKMEVITGSEIISRLKEDCKEQK